MENKIPFLLQNPGDIATFLNKLIPMLKARNWTIISDTEGFNLEKEPLSINFSLESEGKNLFYFKITMLPSSTALPTTPSPK